MKSPCKDCPDRQVGCHGSCEKYAAFRADTLRRAAANREAIIADSAVIEGTLRRTKDYQKGRMKFGHPTVK